MDVFGFLFLFIPNFLYRFFSSLGFGEASIDIEEARKDDFAVSFHDRLVDTLKTLKIFKPALSGPLTWTNWLALPAMVLHRPFSAS
jgi:hypothetical protein